MATGQQHVCVLALCWPPLASAQGFFGGGGGLTVPGASSHKNTGAISRGVRESCNVTVLLWLLSSLQHLPGLDNSLCWLQVLVGCGRSFQTVIQVLSPWMLFIDRGQPGFLNLSLHPLKSLVGLPWHLIMHASSDGMVSYRNRNRTETARHTWVALRCCVKNSQTHRQTECDKSEVQCVLMSQCCRCDVLTHLWLYWNYTFHCFHHVPLIWPNWNQCFYLLPSHESHLMKIVGFGLSKCCYRSLLSKI